MKKKMQWHNQREGIKKMHPTPLPIKVLIKNQNKNNGRLCDTKKILKQWSIINETKINKVKGKCPIIFKGIISY